MLTVDAVAAGAALVAAVRCTVALTEARLRAGHWPVRRCGWAPAAVAVHDVAAGLAGYLLLGALPSLALGDGPARDVLAGVATALTLAVTGRLLHRRRGLPLAAIGRPGALAQEPMLTLRAGLLVRVERRAVRGASRWIVEQLDACRRRAATTDDQLLPALWAPARLRLRESVGVGKTEVALLLLQAQSVVDDASPPRERLLTLLHLVHERSGRAGVRSVLDQAVRGPLRHGRSGAPAWAPGPGAVPGPMPAAAASPFPP
jgi:hypothetical protein